MEIGRDVKPRGDEDEEVAVRDDSPRGGAANNPNGSTRIDFDGCGGWLSEYAIVELTESCVDMFPSLSSLAWPRARALTGRGVSRAMTAADRRFAS